MTQLPTLYDRTGKTALISGCERYRHRLGREWDQSLGVVLFVGLNPSTADATDDDPTIRRCIRFAESWGYGGMLMCNLFDWRSTDPKKLPPPNIAVSEKNDSVLRVSVDRAKLIIAAWGKVPWASERIKEVFQTVFSEDKRWHCLGLTKDGAYPRHPLYMRKDTRPKLFW